MKQRIQLQTQQEIFRTGFRFTMADIARQCGISTKTVYECYSSKEELIRDIVLGAIQTLKEREQALLEDESLGTLDKLKALLVLIPQEFQLFDLKRLHELQRYYPEVWNILNDCIEKQWAGVARVVEMGQAEGLLAQFDIELFVQLYIGGLNQLMEQASSNSAGMTLREALDGMVEILLNGIRRR